MIAYTKKAALITLISFLFISNIYSQKFINEKREAGSFPLVSGLTATLIYTDETDHLLVEKAATLFQKDIEMVTGKKPEIVHTNPASASNVIIIGLLDKSALLKQLVQQNKLNIMNKGKWDG